MRRKTWMLIGADGKPHPSRVPGSLGGHRRTRIYGQLTCRSANAAIRRGGYAKERVFFLNQGVAQRAGFRPCGVCMPLEYKAWKRALSWSG